MNRIFLYFLSQFSSKFLKFLNLRVEISRFLSPDAANQKLARKYIDLKHQNVQRCLDTFTDDLYFYAVKEIPFKTYLTRDKHENIRVLYELISAVGYLHENNIIHMKLVNKQR